MRDSSIFYRSFYEALKDLPAENQAELYTAIFEYSLNFNEVELTGLSNTIFKLIKPQLKANNKKYENGKKGGAPNKENQNETKEEPNNNQNETKSKANVNDNDNLNENYKDKEYNTLFEIKDFNFAISNFSGNKQYFYLCYRYWELYRKEYPNHMHLKTAKFKEWYDSIRLMVESDKQSIDRIVAIYIFLTKCQNKEKGYETFLFSQVKSLTALRKKTASGEYRLDNLATLVNEKLQKDDEFNRSVKKAIETFKTKFQ